MTRILAIALLVASLVGIAAGQRNQTKTHPDEEGIRKILLERVQSFNRHEAPRANTFTADADFVNVYGLWRKGATEIEARQGERMQTALKDARMKLIELRIRFIKPDVAIVHQRHEISGMRDPAGKTMPTVQELSIRVMVRKGQMADNRISQYDSSSRGAITDGGELTHSYSVESGGEVKMTKQGIIEMIQRAGFDPVGRPNTRAVRLFLA